MLKYGSLIKLNYLLEFKVISADQEKCLYHFYPQCPTSGQGNSFYVLPLTCLSSSLISPKVLIFPFSLACVWEIFEKQQHYPSIVKIPADCFLTCHFNIVYPFTSTEYNTLWNTFKTLTISPLKTPLLPPNSLSHDSSFTTFTPRITVLTRHRQILWKNFCQDLFS